MEKQKKDRLAQEESRDADRGSNARNQYSGSGDFSPHGEYLESALNRDEPESPTDLQQDGSGTLKSNN